MLSFFYCESFFFNPQPTRSFNMFHWCSNRFISMYICQINFEYTTSGTGITDCNTVIQIAHNVYWPIYICTYLCLEYYFFYLISLCCYFAMLCQVKKSSAQPSYNLSQFVRRISKLFFFSWQYIVYIDNILRQNVCFCH